MIRNSGARQIADIFRMVPGMLVGYHYGHSPAVTYQGLGTEFQRQLQVLIDGRSVFIPSFGGIPWSNLPLLLEDIERVEVTRGPNAVTYGSNAFLATINIITRHSAEDIGTKISVTHDFDKDKETKDLYLRLGNQYGDLDWKITAGLEQDDGYVDHDSKLLKKLNLRTDFLTAYNQFWTIQAGINKSTFNRGDGGASNLYRDENTSNIYQNLKWEMLQDTVTTTVQLSHTTQDVEDQFVSAPLNQALDEEFPDFNSFFSTLDDITTDINYDRLSSRTDFEIYQNRSLLNNLNLVYGASFRKDNVESFYLFNDYDEHNITTNRLFSSLEWKYLEDFIIDVGFMLEDSTVIDKEYSSRLSLIKKIGNRHSLRLVSSTAKRNPVLYEIIGDTQFNLELPDGLLPFNEVPVIIWSASDKLIPETIKSEEIGLFSEFFKRQLTTDIKLFHYKITDQLNDVTMSAMDPATGITQQFNSVENNGSTTVYGVEASFNFSPQHKNYRLYGGVSRVNVDSSDSNNQDSFPELTGFIGGHVNITTNQQLSTSIYYVDEMSWLDNSTLLDGYIKLDARYQYTLNKKHNTQLEIIGYNLYEEFSEYVKIGSQKRSLLMRISSRF